jgi:hypothetical protein
VRITYILNLHKRYFLCRPFIICHLSIEHTTKIKPNPPDYMRKEKREEKNKRKKEGRRHWKKGWTAASWAAAVNWAVRVS